MRARTLQVAWHGADPVLACDATFMESAPSSSSSSSSSSSNFLFATGGADGKVRLWEVVPEVVAEKQQQNSGDQHHHQSQQQVDGEGRQKRLDQGAANNMGVKFIRTLDRHEGAVNAVRFSPLRTFTATPTLNSNDDGDDAEPENASAAPESDTGDAAMPGASSIDESAKTPVPAATVTTRLLATGGDDRNVLIWQRVTDPAELELMRAQLEPSGAVGAFAEAEEEDVDQSDDRNEFWKVVTMLRGHHSDVYDLSWSHDGRYLVSGSTDNSAIVWDVDAQKQVCQISDHMHYVQGVAWAPPDLVSELKKRASGSTNPPPTEPQEVEAIASEHKEMTETASASASAPAASGPGASPKKSSSKNKATGPLALITTLSSDQTMRVYDVKLQKRGPKNNRATCKHVVRHRVLPNRGKLASTDAGAIDDAIGDTDPVVEGQVAMLPDGGSRKLNPRQNHYRLFADESLQTFFRRLTWTPDGAALIVPGGLLARSRADDADADLELVNCFFIFGRGQLDSPVAAYPVAAPPRVTKAAAVIRCSPVLYKLRPGRDGAPKNQLYDLPWRVIFAVATLDAILLFDTQHAQPFAVVSGIHYASITDLAWAPDGLALMVSSRDGYITAVVFDAGELGEPYGPVR